MRNFSLFVFFLCMGLILSGCTSRLDYERQRFGKGFYVKVSGDLSASEPRRIQEDNRPRLNTINNDKEKALLNELLEVSSISENVPVVVVYSHQISDSGKKKTEKKKDNFRYDPDRSTPDMEKKDSKLAVFSVVAGVLSFASMFLTFYGVLLFGLTSLILVYLARRKMKKNPETTGGYGLTVAALLLVLVTFLISGWLVMSYWSN